MICYCFDIEKLIKEKEKKQEKDIRDRVDLLKCRRKQLTQNSRSLCS